MRRVKFTGVRPRGTLRPRRMWLPGEVVKVENDVARELLESPGFESAGRRRAKPRKGEE